MGLTRRVVRLVVPLLTAAFWTVLIAVSGARAAGDSDGDVNVKVVDARGKALEGLDVLFWVKGWPGGKFRSTNHTAKTDAKGVARVAGAIPGGTRYGVTASVLAKGFVLASHYHWDAKGDAMPEVTIATATAQSCKLRFVDDAGKPVAGVLAYPQMRAAADGVRHNRFVESVVQDVSGRMKIDPRRIVTVSWSSSGPACHRIGSLAKTSVTGSLIAMSVFRKSDLEAVRNVKGRPVFLLHSPGDKTCPYRMAEEARDTLTKAGANVRFETYEGDHGWGGDSVGLARQGLLWLLDPAR